MMAQLTTSREVIEAYKDRLTAIFQENAGGEALNAGIAQSKGEIICFWMLMTTQRQASESGSRLSRPSRVGADFTVGFR